MDSIREETVALLAEKPALAQKLRTVLSVDRDTDQWTFDDIPLDSGEFGELVARGIAERDQNGYRLTDPAAVELALSDGTVAPSTFEAPSIGDLPVAIPAIDTDWARPSPLTAGLVIAGLGLVIGFRLISLPAVLRNGTVVLSGNDPYYYRFLVEQLLAQGEEAAGSVALHSLPTEVATGEPLFVVVLWWTAVLLGGTPAAAGIVLAWYPVFAAILTAVGGYTIARVLFDDQRVSVAALIMFGITPVAAFRTSLGFGDHHAFDYFWQILTLYILIHLTSRRLPRPGVDPRTLTLTSLLGLAITGHTLAWDNSPILIVPIGVAGLAVLASTLRDDAPSLRRLLPIVGGIGIAAILTGLAHQYLGWHRMAVVLTPTLLAVGLCVAVSIAVITRRTDVSPAIRLFTLLLGLTLLVGLTAGMVPSVTARFRDRLGFLLSSRGIVEMSGLFSEQLGTVIGPIFLFGFVLFLGLPYLSWVSWKAVRRHRTAWIVASTYGWYFFVLSIIQIRFAGQLAPVMAVFAGLGFVHLAATIGVARRPGVFSGERIPALRWPDGRGIVTLVGLFLLVASVSFVQIPVKTSQLTIESADYGTAEWIADDADARGLTYPDSYVFTPWDRNRMYNYFVNGHSRSYGYAQSNYHRFAVSTAPNRWYERLHDRVGYIVIETDDRFRSAPRGSLHDQLSTPATSPPHFRAVYRSPTGENLVYTLVPGATITGNRSGTETLTLSTPVTLPGATFTYTRTVSSTSNGRYTVTVPYPGQYRIGNKTVIVRSAAVQNGSTIHV